ncbi:7-cyano-7-deazaguanine synthase [Plantibacter sp. VKM Ac-2885]|uniref:7-cyano-7-deazaguanine synthase n=1 Tax=Plantibacter sp. VKM Ac-2885 TaxID=2783828 RepID=UPI00188D76BD|nr:7-cyano-7-deazaguanine synthase [Plantibacter sp. VKM Ac-2885]MBF4514157.1 7-cyano-7-deazaguanine synthase [Plantibacter sp. VKM Ac-2885]
MTRLALVIDETQMPPDVDEVFFWNDTGDDSFKSGLGPSLMTLGPVPTLNADFVRIALAVYATDHTVKRDARGSNWNTRELIVSVPVSDPSLWDSAANELVEAVNFLTGDHWSFEFTTLTGIAENALLVPDASSRVVLVSGGADSGIGALLSGSTLVDKQTHSLVSHASSGAARTPQKHVHAQLESLFPGRQAAHHRLFLSRAQKRPDGSLFPSEPSSRSRSFLFLALGLSVASQSGASLWIPENGFASINPPLGPERLGALSTRTTQPWFLWKIQNVLASIGAHGTIENPFQLMTKGEMFAQAKTLLGDKKASTYLSATNSCSHTDQNYQGVPSGTHCGECFGCIVRRASFKAGGVVDATRYLSDEPQHATYVASHSVLEAARDFASSTISNATIMVMPLPPSLSARQAMDLCRRGQAEVGAYLG